MTHVTCTQHGPGCERLHVGMRVAVYGRPADTGTVVEIIEDRHFMVAFDSPYQVAEGITADGPLAFHESELVELTREGAMLAVALDILKDPERTMRVVIAALVVEQELRDASRVPAQDAVLNGAETLSFAINPPKGN